MEILRKMKIPKILFSSNIASPYQIEWAKDVITKYECEFWFFTEIKNSETGRPDYWNVELPTFCKQQHSYFQAGEICYAPKLYKKLDEYNPDIVVIGGSWHLVASYQVYRWAVRNKKKIITFPIEFNSNMGQQWKILRNKFIWKFIYKKIDIYCANGFIHYDYLKTVLGAKNVRIFSNFDNYRPYLKHKARSQSDRLRFLYAGSIQPRLRVLELIDIFKKAFEGTDCDQTVELCIAGYGPDKEACIEKVENDHWLKLNVKFHDVKNWAEIPDVYRDSDILLNFGEYSPGGGVIYSAVASGMPVVSMSDLHAIRQVVLDNFNGFHAYSSAEFIKCMQHYYTNDELLAMHSKNSKSIGESFLSNDYHLKQFSQIISEVCEC